MRARPMRTVLAFAQVVLGALAVAAALAATVGAMQGAGPPERFDVRAATPGERVTRGYALFEADALSRILELAPAVADAALAYELDRPVVEVGDRLYQFRSGAAVTPAFLRLGDVEIVAGVGFSDREVQLGERLALISEAAAQALFPGGDALGTELRVQQAGPPYRVVGVFRRVLDPGGPALLLTLDPNFGPLSTLSVLARPGETSAAREQALQATRTVYAERLAELGLGPGEDLLVTTPAEEDPDRDAARLELSVFAALGILALIVGSLGAFTLVTVDTIERRREVGLRRAMGESRLGVVRAFTLEAATTALLGGAVGVAAAWLVLPRLRPSMGPMGAGGLAFEPVAAAMTLGVVVVLNAAFTLPPTLHLTSSRPVEALREE